MIYYNEFDPGKAAWLRLLIAAGRLPAGDVDERSIVEVSGEDLRGYRQCHFFAGIGGWALALRLAGVPAGAEVWTGSCPCQPFSAAGKQKGTDDERHLWPHFRRLIGECRPAAVFGEQVASPLGRAWLSAVRDEMEALGYAVGAADLCAASVGAPHIRQRLYFGAGRLGDSNGPRLEGLAGHGLAGPQPGRDGPYADRPVAAASGSATGSGHADHGGWGRADWLLGRDGRFRPVEPGTSPMADGIPGRVELLRGYGDAIVPQLAAEFVSAFIEAESLT